MSDHIFDDDETAARLGASLAPVEPSARVMTSLPTTWVKLAFSPVTMAVLVAWSNSILAPIASSAARSGTIVRPFFTSGTASVKAMHRSPSSTLTCPTTPPSALMFCSRCSFETVAAAFGSALTRI